MNEFTRFIEAIKIATAVGIAMYIPVSLGWDRPYWAAVAVTMLAVEYTGHQMLRCVSRITATIIGATLAPLFLHWFGQTPFLYILMLALWMSLWMYLAIGSTINYALLLIGITPLFGLLDWGTPNNIFDLAILRIINTLIGATIFMVISKVFWPNHGSRDIKKQFYLTTQAISYFFSLLCTEKHHVSAQPQLKKTMQSIKQLQERYNFIALSIQTEFGSRLFHRRIHEVLRLQLMALCTSVNNLADWSSTPSNFAAFQTPRLYTLTSHIHEFMKELSHLLNRNESNLLDVMHQHLTIISDLLASMPTSASHHNHMSNVWNHLSVIMKTLDKLEKNAPHASLRYSIRNTFALPIKITFAFNLNRFIKAISTGIVIIIGAGLWYVSAVPNGYLLTLIPVLIAGNDALLPPHISTLQIPIGGAIGFALGTLYSTFIAPFLAGSYFFYLPCFIIYFLTYLIIPTLKHFPMRVGLTITFSLTLFFHPYYSPALSNNLANLLQTSIVFMIAALIGFIPSALLFPMKKNR